MTVISASRRTDIPAFFSEWFMGRIREKQFLAVNPFNPRQRRRVSLQPGDVDAIIFWSKAPAPLLPQLAALDAGGYNYLFLYTVNDYPQWLEPGVPSLASRVATFQLLSERLGKDRVIWRYDPIVISDSTPVSYHCDRFAALAEQLGPHTRRVIISFLDLYKSVERRLGPHARRHLQDIRDESLALERRRLARAIRESAVCHGFEVQTCCETVDLAEMGIEPGACIDMPLLNKLFGLDLPAGKDRNQRPGCLCGRAVDMGCYDTCLHNCRYCYAVRSERTAKMNRQHHDPAYAALLKK